MKIAAGTVHPRVRGDMFQKSVGFCSNSGSPPRARGHDNNRLNAKHWVRFTPACAGTWGADTSAERESSVHPRVRGDMSIACSICTGKAGSPPRARGNVSLIGVEAVGRRFTPACAGTWPCLRGSALARPVHPRVRGDMAFLDRGVYPKCGSPPRARGHGCTGPFRGQR